LNLQSIKFSAISSKAAVETQMECIIPKTHWSGRAVYTMLLRLHGLSSAKCSPFRQNGFFDPSLAQSDRLSLVRSLTLSKWTFQ
jgi:hypothetical protein